jgi:glyoxylase-like metal-dependent hydrolase (beta-lactamase superfamily II)
MAAIFAVPLSSRAQSRDSASALNAAMSLPSAEHAMKESARRIADHIYMFHPSLPYGPAPFPNEVLIEQTDGLVLVDAGKTRGAGQRIVALIRQISAKPLKAVIITHWHQDHVLGLGPIVEAWPNVAVITNEATDHAIRTDESYRTTPHSRDSTAARDSARAKALRQYATEYLPHLHDPSLSPEERRGWADVVGVLNQRIADERGTYLVLPTVVFKDRYRLDDAKAPIEAISIGPAHTDGDVVAWMPTQRAVAAGDIIVSPIPYTGSHVVEWPASLAKLKSLKPKLIVPGHGDLETDTSYADLMIGALTEMAFTVQPLVAGPLLSEDSVMKHVDLSQARSRFAGQNHWLGYWFDQYFAPNAATAYTQLRKLADK